MNYEDKILEHVRQHPGCDKGSFDIIGHPNVPNEADYMVEAGKLERWYTGTMARYYIPGTYTPHHLRTG
ncbi:MAG: hypothetical protein BA864_05085 [Desulfuromonadales bacterium C00003093]|nr:MAG: hypothetical protein BA864_05085 [Desulfuromonadales bacterium C00003093]